MGTEWQDIGVARTHQCSLGFCWNPPANSVTTSVPGPYPRSIQWDPCTVESKNLCFEQITKAMLRHDLSVITVKKASFRVRDVSYHANCSRPGPATSTSILSSLIK